MAYGYKGMSILVMLPRHKREVTMAYSETETEFTQFEARRLSPYIGAELIGANLAEPTDTLVSEARHGCEGGRANSKLLALRCDMARRALAWLDTARDGNTGSRRRYALCKYGPDI